MISEFTAILAFLGGAVVLWASPHSTASRVYFFAAAWIALWLLIVQKGGLATVRAIDGPNVDPRQLLRGNAAIAGMIPWLLALLVHTSGHRTTFRRALRWSTPWLGASVTLVALSLAPDFVQFQPGTYPTRGMPYWLYGIAAVITFSSLIYAAIKRLPCTGGLQRVQLEFFALNLIIACLATVSLTTLGNLLHLVALKRIAVLTLIASVALSAWVAASYRVYSARQVIVALAHRISVSLIIGAVIILTWSISISHKAGPLDIGALSVLVCGVGLWIERRTRVWCRLDGRDELNALRASVIHIAKSEFPPEVLAAKFETLLCQHAQNSRVYIQVAAKGTHAISEFTLKTGRLGHPVFLAHGWITREALERLPDRSSASDLTEYLRTHDLGALLAVPHGSPSPSLIVALGRKVNGWAFTYPEIERLQNVAELMDNVLTRSHLVEQAALRARMEHLAMMSRGLAHDLKNLVTPVSSFLIHTEGRYAPNSPEAIVHSAARRSVSVMSDYLRQALFFSEHLEASVEWIDLRKLFAAVHDLCLDRARPREIKLLIDVTPELGLMGDSVLLQRLFGNLVANAIDASTSGQTVSLKASSLRAGWICCEVSDCGQGIAPEHVHRIFDPYFTTKQFSDDVRGFGLGLTISQKIVMLHRGHIRVRTQWGEGTTFIVDLPSEPTPAANAPNTGPAAIT